MPPALGLILSLPIWKVFCVVYPRGVGDAISAGAYLGFVLYDMIHCKQFLKFLNFKIILIMVNQAGDI
jgi:hypothetical protein